jgi:hypothetical protein
MTHFSVGINLVFVGHRCNTGIFPVSIVGLHGWSITSCAIITGDDDTHSVRSSPPRPRGICAPSVDQRVGDVPRRQASR